MSAVWGFFKNKWNYYFGGYKYLHLLNWKK